MQNYGKSGSIALWIKGTATQTQCSAPVPLFSKIINTLEPVQIRLPRLVTDNGWVFYEEGFVCVCWSLKEGEVSRLKHIRS